MTFGQNRTPASEAMSDEWIEDYVARLARGPRNAGNEVSAAAVENKAREFISNARPYLDRLWANGLKIGYFSDLRRADANGEQVDFRSVAPVVLEAMGESGADLVRRDAAEAVLHFANPAMRDVLLEGLATSYSNEADQRTASLSAQAIAKLVKPGDFELLQGLINDPPSQADAELIAAFPKAKDPRAEQLCIRLIEDAEGGAPADPATYVVKQAIHALGAMRSSAARSVIEPYLASPDPEARSEARAAIGKIDKAH